MASHEDARSIPARSTMSAFAVQIAGGILCFFLVTYAASFAAMLLGWGVSSYAVATGLVSIPLWVYMSRDPQRNVGWGLGVASVILSCSVLAASYGMALGFYDQSWDGTAYHQEAIIALAGGWNIFYQPADPASQYAVNLEAYPKAVWIIAASIFKLTGRMEGAKLAGFALMACSFLLLLGALLRVRVFPAWAAVLIPLVAALNPVAIYQSLSFYVDGILASVLLCFIGLGLLVLYEPKRRYFVLLGAVIAFTINIKQTGIVYVGVLALSLLVLYWGYGRARVFKPGITTMLIGGGLGAALLGYNPYITNTLAHHNPFYPVIGERIDIQKTQRPQGLEERAGVVRLLVSTFSESDTALAAEPKLKIPFTVAGEREVAMMSGTDVRLAGWGVLFSGALVLALAGLLWLHRVPRPYRTAGLVLLLSVTASVLINPEAWWARFVPQWYLVPVLLSAMLFLATGAAPRILATLIALLLLLNAGLVGYAYYPLQHRESQRLAEYLQRIKQARTPIDIYFSYFPSNRVRLSEAGIRYRQLPTQGDLRCRSPHPIFRFEGLFCFRGER